MKISARSDYALRACIELARAGDLGSTSDELAEAQGISQPFLQNILGELRRAGYVRSTSRRGGGYWLARPPGQITVADVLRAVDGPLLRIHGLRPDQLSYPDPAGPVAGLWLAVRATVAELLETVNLHDLASGRVTVPVPAGAGSDGSP